MVEKCESDARNEICYGSVSHTYLFLHLKIFKLFMKKWCINYKLFIFYSFCFAGSFLINLKNVVSVFCTVTKMLYSDGSGSATLDATMTVRMVSLRYTIPRAWVWLFPWFRYLKFTSGTAHCFLNALQRLK